MKSLQSTLVLCLFAAIFFLKIINAKEIQGKNDIEIIRPASLNGNEDYQSIIQENLPNQGVFDFVDENEEKFSGVGDEKKNQRNLSDNNSRSFEVVVNGQRFKTLHDYKLQKFKVILKAAMEYSDLGINDISEEEFSSILRELKVFREGSPSPNFFEMKKMISDYNKKDGKKLSVDLSESKVKTIIISPDK